MKIRLLLIWLLLIFSAVLFVAACSDSPENNQGVTAPIPSPTRIKVPSDYGTIMEAIEQADAGDTILVAPGVYSGDGNRGITIDGKNVVLLSESGPEETVIDCGGGPSHYQFGLIILGKADGLVIDGFTIRNGYAPQGAAIMCQTASPIIRNCIFYNNTAYTSGGAIRCKGSSPHIVNCTFVGNSAKTGGALQTLAGANPALENCIIAYSGDGGAVYANEHTSIPQLSCCLLYGNVDGNWTGKIADQAEQNGNLEEEPRFCLSESGNFRLQSNSVCLPDHNDCGVLIGALGGGCD